MVIIGDKLKNLRKENSLTQEKLARKVGVTKSAIAAYENNSRLPSYSVLIKLCDILNVSIDYLLLDSKKIFLEITDLNNEQVDILKKLINTFKENNRLKN